MRSKFKFYEEECTEHDVTVV